MGRRGSFFQSKLAIVHVATSARVTTSILLLDGLGDFLYGEWTWCALSHTMGILSFQTLLVPLAVRIPHWNLYLLQSFVLHEAPSHRNPFQVLRFGLKNIAIERAVARGVVLALQPASARCAPHPVFAD